MDDQQNSFAKLFNDDFMRERVYGLGTMLPVPPNASDNVSLNTT
jgi:hypothetical protein